MYVAPKLIIHLLTFWVISHIMAFCMSNKSSFIAKNAIKRRESLLMKLRTL